METIKTTRPWGNGAGVLLPREWVGKEVKVVLIERTSNIKKEVFSILAPCLDDIKGIYLTGSHARGEQAPGSDIDIIAISGRTSREMVSGKYNVSIIPLKSVKKAMKSSPILILPRLMEAKPILNRALLEELRGMPVAKAGFRGFLVETKRIIRINREFLELESGKEINLPGVVYSLILRLRGIFLASCILKKRTYSNHAFKSWLMRELKSREIRRAYRIYEDVKNDRKASDMIKLSIAWALLKLLEREVAYFGKKKQKA